jgi:hypothetical protein
MPTGNYFFFTATPPELCEDEEELLREELEPEGAERYEPREADEECRLADAAYPPEAGAERYSRLKEERPAVPERYEPAERSERKRDPSVEYPWLPLSSREVAREL